MTDKHTKIAEQFAETIDLLIAAQEAWQCRDIELTKQLVHLIYHHWLTVQLPYQ